MTDTVEGSAWAKETKRKRDASQEVIAPHSIGEAGEPVPGDPGDEKGVPDQLELAKGKMTETLGLDLISTRRREIAELASIEPARVLTTLAHCIDLEWMHEAYRQTRKDGAVGVDGVSAQAYEMELEANLTGLLERFKSGQYRAPAVRRVYIEKDGGRAKRPIGIPSLEDKILQRAVLMVLEPVYEQDFKDCSYGFRPNRSAHQALDRLWRGMMDLRDCWVIDLDIRAFFDSVDRTHLNGMLDQRVRDGVIRRTVGKWLQAGVLENGVVHYPEKGTPQGGVISPLLANIYLHEVLDVWFDDQVKPRLDAAAFMVRYADDAVLCFRRESDARRVMAVLSKRLERFGLELNEQKTKLLHLRPPRRSRVGRPEEQSSENSRAFDFLGFTHFWGRTRKGGWAVKRKTAGSRFGRSLKRVAQWCRLNRHLSLAEQQAALNRQLRGHYAYFGITGNSAALSRFRREIERAWRKWLARRSHKTVVSWDRFKRVLARYPLLTPRVMHSVYARSESLI
jgi:RNA-directed DNA polymerase